MKFSSITIPAALLALTFATSCEDEVSQIGSSLSKNEVSIIADSLSTKLKATAKTYNYLDSRSTTKLVGRIDVPEYGKLKASFVSQLMCVVNMDIPDSIPVEYVDSMKMIMRVPRGSFTGDSLAPQQLKVYRLTKPLPSDINNNFNPEGYYDTKPLGTGSYTLSAISMSDSAFKKRTYIDIPVTLPKKFATESFLAYRNNPSIFEWPADFAKLFPGLYVEQNFGRGCLANIADFHLFTYYHHTEMRSVMVDSAYQQKPVLVKDSIALFASAPEVLSSNNITYEISDKIKQLVSEGKQVLTTPGGYYSEIIFPVNEIIEKYRENDDAMAVISDLTFKVPARTIPNNFDIDVSPYLLMIKSSEMDNFFAENKIPDRKTSFWATYNSSTGVYDFSSMREYLMELITENEPDVKDEDMTFSLVPVLITTEVVKNPYTGATTTYVTKCTPYIGKPSMTVLDTDNAQINFTYSLQVIK